jgi:chromosome segregation ATPase
MARRTDMSEAKKRVGVEEIMGLVRDWEWTKWDSTPANATLKLSALEATITAICEQRDEAVEHLQIQRNEIAKLENEFDSLRAFNDQLVGDRAEYRSSTIMLVTENSDLKTDRDEWKRRAEEAAEKIEDWRSDLLGIKDEPISGDPIRTVGLVLASIERQLTRLSGEVKS